MGFYKVPALANQFAEFDGARGGVRREHSSSEGLYGSVTAIYAPTPPLAVSLQRFWSFAYDCFAAVGPA